MVSSSGIRTPDCSRSDLWNTCESGRCVLRLVCLGIPTRPLVSAPSHRPKLPSFRIIFPCRSTSAEQEGLQSHREIHFVQRKALYILLGPGGGFGVQWAFYVVALVTDHLADPHNQV